MHDDYCTFTAEISFVVMKFLHLMSLYHLYGNLTYCVLVLIR